MEDYTKDPQAVLDFAFDWSNWLKEDEEIKSKDDGGYIISVDEGIMVNDDMLANKIDTDDDGEPIIVHANSMIVIWLSGGTPKKKYDVACKILTTANRIDERTMRIYVMNR